MIIKQPLFISLAAATKSAAQPNLDYDKLKNNNLVDKRGINNLVANNNEEGCKQDFSELCKKSLLPIPGYTDYWDDPSSESYYPHSDWQGPTGNSWIQGDGYDK